MKSKNPKFEILDKIEELPSLPQVLVGISKVASDPKSSADDLANMILNDQALTLKVLRIANSAHYAMYSQRITTVSKAVVLLGFQTVKAIALGAEMYRLLSTLVKAGKILERFWKDAISVAVASQEIGRLLGVATAEEAFVAGLLHDIGKLILAQHNPEMAREIYSLELPGQALLDAETAAFGVNHAEIGGELARRWELPPEIRSAMEDHHKHFPKLPNTGGEQLAFIVAVAKTMVAPIGEADPLKHRALAAKIARVLIKPVGLVLETLKVLPEKIGNYAEFFDIQVDDLKVYTLWVEQENQRLSSQSFDQEKIQREQQRQKALMSTVREIHALLLSQQGVATIAGKVAVCARDVIGVNRVLVCTLMGGGQIEGLWHAGDVEQSFTDGFRRALVGKGLISQVLIDSQPLNVLDASIPYFSRMLTTEEQELLDSPCLVVLPVLVRKEISGLIYVDRETTDEPFDDEEVANLQTLADMLALAIKP
jgi:putative nucleotidyltransferase with HDIG domain